MVGVVTLKYVRVAVGTLVVALVGLHGEKKIARLTPETTFVPYLHRRDTI